MPHIITNVAENALIEFNGDLEIQGHIKDGAVITVIDGDLTITHAAVRIGRNVTLKTINSSTSETSKCNIRCYATPGEGATILSDNIIFLNDCEDNSRLWAIGIIRANSIGYNCTVTAGEMNLGTVYNSTTLDSQGNILARNFFHDVTASAAGNIKLFAGCGRNNIFRSRKKIEINGVVGINPTLIAGEEIHVLRTQYKKGDPSFAAGKNIVLYNAFGEEPVEIIEQKTINAPRNTKPKRVLKS